MSGGVGIRQSQVLLRNKFAWGLVSGQIDIVALFVVLDLGLVGVYFAKEVMF